MNFWRGLKGNVKLVAFKASSGVVVSNFFHIYLKKDPWVSWNARKTELSYRFADLTDAQLLRRVKQVKNRSHQQPKLM